MKSFKKIFFIFLTFCSFFYTKGEEAGISDYNLNGEPEILNILDPGITLYDDNIGGDGGQAEISNHVQKHENEGPGEIANNKDSAIEQLNFTEKLNETLEVEAVDYQNHNSVNLSDSFSFNATNNTEFDEQSGYIFDEIFHSSLSNKTINNFTTTEQSIENDTQIIIEKEIDMFDQGNPEENVNSTILVYDDLNIRGNKTENVTLLSDGLNFTISSNITDDENSTTTIEDELLNGIQTFNNTENDINTTVSYPDELDLTTSNATEENNLNLNTFTGVLNGTQEVNITEERDLNPIITEETNMTEDENLNGTSQLSNIDFEEMNVTDRTNTTFSDQLNMTSIESILDAFNETDTSGIMPINQITNAPEISTNATEISTNSTENLNFIDFEQNDQFLDFNSTLFNSTDEISADEISTNLTYDDSNDPAIHPTEAEFEIDHENKTNESPDPLHSTELPTLLKNDSNLDSEIAHSIWSDETFIGPDNSTGNDSFPFNEGDDVAESILYDFKNGNEFNESDTASNEMNNTISKEYDLIKDKLKATETILSNLVAFGKLDLLSGDEKKTFFEETFTNGSLNKWYKYKLKFKNFTWTGRGKKSFTISDKNNITRVINSRNYDLQIWTKFTELEKLGKTLIFQYSISSPNQNSGKCSNVQVKLYDCSVKPFKGWKQPILVSMENVLCPNYETFYTSINKTVFNETERRYNSIFTLEMNKDDSFKMLVNGEMKISSVHDETYKRYYKNLYNVCRMDLYVWGNGFPLDVSNILLTSNPEYAQAKRREFLNNISV